MKNHKFFTLLILFCFSIKPLPNLWAGVFDSMIFSDRSYARCIEAYGWVATEDQLAEVFTKHEDPVQLPFRELNKKHVYFIFRLKNLEPYRAWGTLTIDCPDIGSSAVDVMNVAPRTDKNEYYVIPIGNPVFSESKFDRTPHLCFKWKKLYVK